MLLHGCKLLDLAPEVVASMPKQIINTKIVEQALENRASIRDIKGGLFVYGQIEYFDLWDALLAMTLSTEEDHHRWRHDNFGTFSSKSAS